MHAIRAHSLFRSLSGCLHALTARAGLPSSHTCNRQPTLTASDLRGDMCSCAGALVDRPRLVEKKKVRSGGTSDGKQTVKESPSTHRDPSVKHASKTLRQREVTRKIWPRTSQTDTPNFSESSQNDRLANVIINPQGHPYTARSEERRVGKECR